jgi:hypothetical protein
MPASMHAEEVMNRSVLVSGPVLLICAAAWLASCDQPPAEAPAASSTAGDTAAPGVVEMTRFAWREGRLVAGPSVTLTAEQYRALVEAKKDLMARAAAAKKGKDEIEEHQQAIYRGFYETNSPWPGIACSAQDIWFYDISNGWLDDGRHRFVGCFFNSNWSNGHCTSFSAENLLGAGAAGFSSTSTGGKYWGNEVRSIWGGACPGALNDGPFRYLDIPEWAQVNETPPWNTLWILDN